jgi:hypothetical protein
MKRILYSTLTCAFIAMTLPTLKAANPSSSGTLTVTASIDPSISLTFASDASGLALTSGSLTNTATMALGHIAAYGYTPPTGVTQTVNGSSPSTATNFSVSTPFDVLVMEANTISSSYTLTAALNSADSTNTWKVDGTAVTSGTPISITSSATYDTAASHTLLITVPFTNTTGSISNAINFVATAN